MPLSEHQTGILQQILAAHSTALSIEEITYRNTDLSGDEIEQVVEELANAGLITPYDAITPDDIPSVYWTPTTEAVDELDEMGMLDEIEVLSEADDALDRTDRIKQIEGEKPDVSLLIDEDY